MEHFFIPDFAARSTESIVWEHFPKQFGYDDYVLALLSFLGIFIYITNGKLWNKPDPYQYKLFERPQEALRQNAAPEQTRDIAKKLKETNKDLVIFWGSQSGTAEAFAHRLARECHRRFKLEPLVADLSDYDHDTITQIPTAKFAIIILSTYGEGDPSDNAADFLHWINSKSLSLQNLRYSAFGLGNSNYTYYNKVVDVVVERLDALGAVSLLPAGKADDANSETEEDFLAWKERLFRMCQADLRLEEHEIEYEPTIKVTEDTSLDTIDLHLGQPIRNQTPKRSRGEMSAVGMLPVQNVRKLTSEASGDKNYFHVEVDLRNHAQMKYKTGDHLAVWPVNPTEEVHRLLNALDWSAKKDIPLLVSPLDVTNKGLRIPSPTTYLALFQHYLEISAPVSRETIQALCQFAPSKIISSFLHDISSTKDAYSTFLDHHHVTLARFLEYTVLQDTSASWSHLRPSFVIECFHPMVPRYFSISSSSTASPRHASITVAVDSTPLPSDPSMMIPGLATTYLSSFSGARPTLPSLTYPSTASDGRSFHAQIRRSTFKLPINTTAPIVLIAAGAGIAPMRAFLHERAKLASMGRESGRILLFFGCRHPEQDYIYRGEIEELQAGILKNTLEVVTAFSRVPGQKSVYVQDRLGETVWKENVAKLVVDEDATLYFCGSTAMAKAAGEKIVEAVQEYKNLDEHGVASWRNERKRVRRWQEDVWG